MTHYLLHFSASLSLGQKAARPQSWSQAPSDHLWTCTMFNWESCFPTFKQHLHSPVCLFLLSASKVGLHYHFSMWTQIPPSLLQVWLALDQTRQEKARVESEGED